MHEQCSMEAGQPLVDDCEEIVETSQHDSQLVQHFGNDVSTGEQFGLQGETVTIEADDGDAHSLSSNNTSIGISKVYKMKRSCTYSPKSQGSEVPPITLAHSESSQQCSERKEIWWSCLFAPST